MNCHAYIEIISDDTDAWSSLRRMKAAARLRDGKVLFHEAQRAWRGSSDIFRGLHRRVIQRRSALTKAKAVELHCIMEQLPNHNSRITLSERHDALGVPISKVDWKISEVEQRTAEYMAQCLCREFKQAGLPTPHIERWLADNGWASHCVEKAHPSGTTRMSAEPKTGVVDTNSQVYGVRGLFVAGGSVFPTCGAVNPTLTIVAMSLRLADRLRKEMFAAPSSTLTVKDGPGSNPTAIKVGIVGAGRRVREFYVPVLKALHPRYEIVGFTTRSKRSAQRLEAEIDATPFSSPQELVARRNPTFLIVAVQDRQNEATILDALDLSVPMLAETPLAWTVNGVRRIMRKAATKNVSVGVAEQFPYFPLEQFRKQLIEADVLGSVYSALNDRVLYSYHAIAQLRRYLKGRAKSASSHNRSGAVEFDNGATLVHKYGLLGKGENGVVRLYGTSAVMSDYTINLTRSALPLVAVRELTSSGTLESICVDISSRNKIRWHNAFSNCRFSDEQIAVGRR